MFHRNCFRLCSGQYFPSDQELITVRSIYVAISYYVAALMHLVVYYFFHVRSLAVFKSSGTSVIQVTQGSLCEHGPSPLCSYPWYMDCVVFTVFRVKDSEQVQKKHPLISCMWRHLMVTNCSALQVFRDSGHAGPNFWTWSYTFVLLLLEHVLCVVSTVSTVIIQSITKLNSAGLSGRPMASASAVFLVTFFSTYIGQPPLSITPSGFMEFPLDLLSRYRPVCTA